MKTVCKKLFSLMLVAVLLVSVVPFQAFAIEPMNIYLGIQYLDVDFDVRVVEPGTVISTKIPVSSAIQASYDKRCSDGKVFDGWYFTTGIHAGQKADISKKLSVDMGNDGNVGLEARFVFPDVTVTLNANGGKVDTTTIKAKKQDLYGTLPTPTRAGYDFAGWYTNVNDESTRVTSGMNIPGNVTLYAKWTTGAFSVIFQRWNGEEFVDNATCYITNGKSFKENGTAVYPYTEDGFGSRAGYSVNEDYPWVDENGNRFTEDTKITRNMKIRPAFKANTYTITYNFTCTELSEEKQEVVFGSTVTLKQPTRTNYVFQGWKVAHDGKEMKTGDTYLYGDITLVAQWAPKGTVELRVYRDDADGFKTYYYSGAILNGELNLNNCKIENYLKGDYEFDGWFDNNRWIDYLGTKSTKGVEEASHTITRLESIKTSTDESSVTIIYGMVKGYKATGTGNNNTNNTVNTGTPDPSNPQTGDTIMIAVSTMAVAAAALVVLFELKKRKMI